MFQLYYSLYLILAPFLRERMCNVSLMCCLCNHYVTVYVLRMRNDEQLLSSEQELVRASRLFCINAEL